MNDGDLTCLVVKIYVRMVSHIGKGILAGWRMGDGYNSPKL